MNLNMSLVAVLAAAVVLVPFGAGAASLTAGDYDDNLNYEHFLRYQASFRNSTKSALAALNLQERVTIRVVDADSRPVANARVSVSVEGSSSPFIETRADSYGVFQFFPGYDGAGGATRFTVQVSPPDAQTPVASTALSTDEPAGNGTVVVGLEGYHATPPQSLDILLVIDTTGSMGDELGYLTGELSTIIGSIRNEFAAISMRFGLVVYRDEGDVYVVRSFGFTDSLKTMQRQLAEQSAYGGGDYPEAMDRALKEAAGYPWRDGNTARMLLLVADAPPHDEKMQAAMDEVDAARRAGVHIYSLAGSGVGSEAEYFMRAAALLTGGRYLFLTDDSGIGGTHAEPAIPCYLVTNLDGLLVRVIGGELAGRRIEPQPPEVIRTVGNYSEGICMASGGGAGSKPSSSASSSSSSLAPTGTASKSSAAMDRYTGASAPASDGFEDMGFTKASGAPARVTAAHGTLPFVVPSLVMAAAVVGVLVAAGLYRNRREKRAP